MSTHTILNTDGSFVARLDADRATDAVHVLIGRLPALGRRVLEGETLTYLVVNPSDPSVTSVSVHADVVYNVRGVSVTENPRDEPAFKVGDRVNILSAPDDDDPGTITAPGGGPNTWLVRWDSMGDAEPWAAWPVDRLKPVDVPPPTKFYKGQRVKFQMPGMRTPTAEAGTVVDPRPNERGRISVRWDGTWGIVSHPFESNLLPAGDA